MLSRTLFLGYAAAWLVAPGAAEALTPEQWREDIQFLAHELPRLHKNAFFKTSRTDFEAGVRKIVGSLPAASDLQIQSALVKLVASLGDGHTGINALRGGPVYPIAFRVFPDGLYVVGTAPDQTDSLGARLIAINQTPAAEVRARLQAYGSRENEASAMAELPGWMNVADVLKAEEITDGGPAEFRLQRQGPLYSLKLTPAERVRLLIAAEGAKRPLYLSRRGEAYKDYWYEYLPEGKTLYIQYNACRNMKEQPFSAFVAEAMGVADGNGARKFVVDLRANGGGDSRVVGPLIGALKQRRAAVYGLVGRNTFSSGFWAAQDLKRKLGAVLVGEAMGQKPNSYGEVRRFKLPHSGLVVRYSTQYWRLVKGSDPAQVEPDVRIDLQPADFPASRDPVMEYVLAH